MANHVYPLGKKHVMQKEIDLTANTTSDRLRTRLVRISGSAAKYAYADTDEFLAAAIDGAIATADGGASGTTDQNVGACTVVQVGGNAVLTPGSPSVTHPTVSSTGSLAVAGDQFAVVLFHWTGSAATSQLLAYFDTGPGLPIIPDGGDETIQWNSGTDKIFSL